MCLYILFTANSAFQSGKIIRCPCIHSWMVNDTGLIICIEIELLIDELSLNFEWNDFYWGLCCGSQLVCTRLTTVLWNIWDPESENDLNLKMIAYIVLYLFLHGKFFWCHFSLKFKIISAFQPVYQWISRYYWFLLYSLNITDLYGIPSKLFQKFKQN